MGNKIVECGEVGEAQKFKICNNMANGVEMASIAEALHLSKKLGLDPVVMAKIMCNSTAKCYAVDTKTPISGVLDHPVPADEDYEFGFASKLMVKDMSIALEVAQKVGARVPLSEATSKLYQGLVEAGLESKDISVLYRELDRK